MLPTMTCNYRQLLLRVQRARNLRRVMGGYVRPLFTLASYRQNRLIQHWQDPTSQVNGVRLYSMPPQNVSALEKQVVSAVVEKDGRQLVITWMDGVKSRYHSLWLRFSCHCPKCFQADSNMNLIFVEEIESQTVLERVSVSDDGLTISLLWNPGGHSGTIGLDHLRANRYDPDALATRHHLTTPLFLEEEDPIPEVKYEEVNASDKGMYKWLSYINNYGICLMKDVPIEKMKILQVVEKIAPVQKTIYGTVFDVVQEPTPSNVAYTPVRLPFHMDLVYYEGAPGLQFLHCLRIGYTWQSVLLVGEEPGNILVIRTTASLDAIDSFLTFDDTVKGGDTTFVDLLRVSGEFRKRYPAEFKVLTRIPVIFARVHSAREHPVHIVNERKHIEVNEAGEVVRVNWNPGTQSPMAVPEEDLDVYYDAYLKFANMINTSPSYRKLRLRPGDLIGFNNRRMAHGRTAYEETAAGHRHLQGCYINIDEFKSRVQVLSLTVGDGSLAKRVFNGSSF